MILCQDRIICDPFHDFFSGDMPCICECIHLHLKAMLQGVDDSVLMKNQKLTEMAYCGVSNAGKCTVMSDIM